ncbi:hypothetical protein NHX12_003255, partial [Muraenolepis orangiensis]
MAQAEVVLINTGEVGFEFRVLQDNQGPMRRNEEEAEVVEEEEEDEEGDRGGEGGRVDREGHHGPAEQEREVLPGQPLVFPARGYVEARSEWRLCVFYLPGVPEVFQKTEEIYGQDTQQAREAVGAPLATTVAEGQSPDDCYCAHTYEELVSMELERRLVRDHALVVTSSLMDRRHNGCSVNKWHKLSSFQLPEYVLHFGFVVHGQNITRVVRIRNTGPVSASFGANLKPLVGTGFSAEFENVKNLPCGKTQTFTVTFDPQKSKFGEIKVIMPIKVVDGPSVQVRLSAVVTMPAITVSREELQFDSVQCGMCQVITIQLLNHESVLCSWSLAEQAKPRKKLDKFLPLHLRKKALQEQSAPPPAVFEMEPSSGLLQPGDRVNVQVKFIPAQEGRGLEPRLEFSPAALELAPCLPCSAGTEAQVTVTNPCSFPVEFYSLELDLQHQEEDQILRLMQEDYEEGQVLLPSRAAGEGFPRELLDHYSELCSSHEVVEGGREKTSQGQLETSPLSRAIARHVGIDLSPEGVAARNRRGVAILVHGAPLTGSSPASLAARQLYLHAVTEHAQKKAKEAGPAVQDVPVEASTAPTVEGDTLSLENTEDLSPGQDPTAPEMTQGRDPTAPERIQSRNPTAPERTHALEPTAPERTQGRNPTAPERTKGRGSTALERTQGRNPTAPERTQGRNPTAPERTQVRDPTAPERTKGRNPTAPERTQVWDPTAPERTKGRGPAAPERKSLETSTVSKIINQVEDVDTLQGLLPHQLLVDLLAERLQ